MYELMLWRARVGLFNGTRGKSHRTRHILSKSDITPCVMSIYKFYYTLFYIQHLSHTPNYNSLSTLLLSVFLVPLTLLLSISLSFHKLRSSLYFKIKIIIIYHFIYLPILLILSGDIHPNPGPVNKNFSICHLNAMSLTAAHRVNDIHYSLVDYHGFDIIAVTETHLDNSVQSHEVELQSYTLHRRDRNRSGGGVAIYCRDLFTATRRLDLEHPDLEIIWLEINISNKRHLVSSCYRPPGQSRGQVQIFLSHLKTSIELALSSNPFSLTILGDFNDRCTL